MNTAAARARIPEMPEATVEQSGPGSVMIQIRNVPESLHRSLKSKAALEGLSLSDLLLREIEAVALKPTLHEWLNMLDRTTPPMNIDSSGAAGIIREMRGQLPD